MDILRITLTEEGGVRQFTPDFKVMRGSYGNILINIEVPKSLLIEPVEEDGENVTGNSVRIGAIIRTATGHNLQTQRYEFARIREYTDNEIDYVLYQRKAPKTFTAWETVNQLEATGPGILEMLINVINWSVVGEARVEEITASPTFTLPVYPSTYLENGEEIDDPSDLSLLQSQVQDIAARLELEESEISRIEGVGLTENGFTEVVSELSDGFYIANTERFGQEIVIISQGGTLISRITGEGLSYRLDSGAWVTSTGGVPPSGTVGQVLAKAGSADYVVEWVNGYELPTADSITIGGVKAGGDIAITENGIVTVPALVSKADLVEGKVPASQLPSFVDDVLEYQATTSFPNEGESGKIYVATNTNKTYRWSGTQYVVISASLAIGATAETAAAGNHTHTYDQTYSATSENAQSGVAVAQAIASAITTALNTGV